jgi:hypothetical protein
MSHLDRSKYDADVLDHVVRGVVVTDTDEQPQGTVVSVDGRAWLAGWRVSAVQVSAIDKNEPPAKES